MKKLFMAALIAAATLTLTACEDGKASDSNSTSDSSSEVAQTALTPAEKTAKLLSEVSFPEMRKLESADDLKAVIGVDTEKLTEYSVYICPSGMSPDEFGILVAVDEAAAAEIKTVIDNRVAYQEDTFRNYPLAAEEVYKLDDYYVSVKGNVVSYAICADNSKASEILG